MVFFMDPLDQLLPRQSTFYSSNDIKQSTNNATFVQNFPTTTGVNETDHASLKFSYSASANLKWMKNFWLCKNNTDFQSCTGYIASLAQFMADALKMDISLELASADGLGSMLSNGTWTPGVTRDVIDGRADFSIGLWDPGRCKSTVCLDYMFETSFSVLVPLPKAKELFTAFMEPFSTSTWITFAVCFFAIGIFLSSQKAKHYKDFTWLGLVATVLGQDYSGNMTTGFSRNGRKWKFMPMAAWVVAMAFLSICYSAVVIKYFMNQLEDQIDRWGKLAESDYNITVNPTLVSFFQALANSRNPTLTQLAAKTNKLDNQPPDYYPAENEAYIDDETLLFLRLDGLREAGDKRYKKSYTFTEKNVFNARYRTAFFSSQFKNLDAASKASRKFVEFGFSEYNRRAYLAEPTARMNDNYKGSNEKEILRPIKLKNVYGWFVVLLIGEAFAFAAFVWEIVRKKYRMPVERFVGHLEAL